MAKDPWNQTNLFEAPPADAPKKVVVKIPTGTPPSECRSEKCKARIFFVPTASGREMPVDADGTPHHATCKDVGAFRRGKS